MLEQIWYFFEEFWSPMNTAGYTDGINFTFGIDNQVISLTGYLTMLSTIVVGVLIIAVLIGAVVWCFKWFSGLIRN